MWLINARTFQLEEFHDAYSVSYAILSHRWEEEEVLFRHVYPSYELQVVQQMRGFPKINMCCQQALSDGINYIWVDTCCIDKSSSAELQEAINSMFRWYAEAVVCYAYLSDVNDTGHELPQFSQSQWFKRGWTLQELVAPAKVEFFNQHWQSLGGRVLLAEEITAITGIRRKVLEKGFNLNMEIPISEIMGWAKGRITTRIEDRAYSLLGLFGVNMGMLYGEGYKSFRRLQEEILKNTEDQSIFAWYGLHATAVGPGLLATSPGDFDKLDWSKVGSEVKITRRATHTVTNEGINLTVELIPWVPFVYLGLLNCKLHLGAGKVWVTGVFLRRLDMNGRYIRIRHQGRSLLAEEWNSDSAEDCPQRYKQITVVQRVRKEELNLDRTSAIPFYGFTGFDAQHMRYCSAPYDNSDQIFHPMSDIYNVETRRFGLSPGTSGRVVEVTMFRRTCFSLGFFEDFIPYCFIYRGLTALVCSVENITWVDKDRWGLRDQSDLWVKLGWGCRGEYAYPSKGVVGIRPGPATNCLNRELHAIIQVQEKYKRIEFQIRIWAPPENSIHSEPEDGWRVTIDTLYFHNDGSPARPDLWDSPYSPDEDE